MSSTSPQRKNRRAVKRVQGLVYWELDQARRPRTPREYRVLAPDGISRGGRHQRARRMTARTSSSSRHNRAKGTVEKQLENTIDHNAPKKSISTHPHRHPRPRDYLSRRGSCLGACSLGKKEILHSSKLKMFLLDPNANLALHSPRCERQHSTWVPFGTCIMLGGELGVLPPFAIFHSAAPCHCCRLQTATGAHCCRLGPKAHQAACACSIFFPTPAVIYLFI